MESDRVADEIQKLNVLVSEVRADVRALAAMTERSGKKHEMHFASHSELKERVHGIERDYVSQAQMKRHEDEQRQDRKQFEESITRLHSRYSVIVAVASATVILVNLFAGSMLR